jgi:hypothetical protein
MSGGVGTIPNVGGGMLCVVLWSKLGEPEKLGIFRTLAQKNGEMHVGANKKG